MNWDNPSLISTPFGAGAEFDSREGKPQPGSDLGRLCNPYFFLHDGAVSNPAPANIFRGLLTQIDQEIALGHKEINTQECNFLQISPTERGFRRNACDHVVFLPSPLQGIVSLNNDVVFSVTVLFSIQGEFFVC